MSLPPPPPPRVATIPIRFDAIDGLRGLMALHVAIYHLSLYFLPDLGRGSIWLRQGHYAVTVFIAISGFCLMYPIIGRGLVFPNGFLHFMGRRVLRIYPALVGALGLATLLRALREVEINGFALGINLLMLSDLRVFHAINPLGVTWSLGAEWHVYLLMPLLLLSIRRWGWVATGVILCVLVAVMLAWPSLLMDYVLCPYYILSFYLGAAVAFIVRHDLCPSVRRRLPLAIIVLGVLVAEMVLRQVEVMYIDMVAQMLAALTIWYVTASPDAPLARILGWTPLKRLGDVSYSLYLIHMPVFVILFRMLAPGYAPWIMVPLALATAICAAALFAAFFEFPFQRMRDRLPLSARVHSA